MAKVKTAIQGQELASVSFVWMRENGMPGWVVVLYKKALLGLHAHTKVYLGIRRR